MRNTNEMYHKLPYLVYGFHGCDESIARKVIANGEELTISKNEYDWLGSGIYFWENSFSRAYEWAVTASKRPNSSIRKPAVIGAIINLGYCLNLTDYYSSEVLAKGYELLVAKSQIAGMPLPINKRPNKAGDELLRNLDCAVIEQIHEYNHENGKTQYDSVRGAFIEGDMVYEGAGFKEKTHIQICIRNPNCIKGYFFPKEMDHRHPNP